MKKISQESDFNFFIPAEIEKAKDKQGNEVMRVKGIASTADEDSEGEVLLPIGFDLSRFLSTGYINWNHQGKSDPSKIIGEPDIAKITKNGDLYIEGVLYPESDLAKSVWKLGETLSRNSKTRKIGWSIEGRALERDIVNPKKITKALITGVALTPTPVNIATYVDLVKGTQKQDFTEYEDDILQKAENSKYIFEFSCDSKKYGITKSFEVEELIEKGGEGSRGGKVIGHTRSGKPIYADNERNYSDQHLEKLVRGRLEERHYEEMSDEEVNYLHNYANANLFNSNLDKVSKERVRDWWKSSSNEISRRKKNIQKDMTTSNTSALVPESLDGKKISLTPEIRKAVMNGLIPIEKLLKKIKK